MKKQLLVLLILVLLAGCTMEKERNEILGKVSEMGSKLSELEELAAQKDFSQFRANVESANAILDELNAMIGQAEEKGEKPEFLNRARQDTAYLKGLFSSLISTVELVQKMEDIKPVMEQLRGRDVSALDTAITQLGEIVGGISTVRESIRGLLGLSGALSKEDYDMLNAQDAMDKMMEFERQVSARELEFNNLKAQLESLKENVS